MCRSCNSNIDPVAAAGSSLCCAPYVAFSDYINGYSLRRLWNSRNKDDWIYFHIEFSIHFIRLLIDLRVWNVSWCKWMTAQRLASVPRWCHFAVIGEVAQWTVISGRAFITGRLTSSIWARKEFLANKPGMENAQKREVFRSIYERDTSPDDLSASLLCSSRPRAAGNCPAWLLEPGDNKLFPRLVLTYFRACKLPLSFVLNLLFPFHYLDCSVLRSSGSSFRICACFAAHVSSGANST